MMIRAKITSKSGYIVVEKTRITPQRRLLSALLYKTPCDFVFETRSDEVAIHDRLLSVREPR